MVKALILVVLCVNFDGISHAVSSVYVWPAVLVTNDRSRRYWSQSFSPFEFGGLLEFPADPLALALALELKLELKLELRLEVKLELRPELELDIAPWASASGWSALSLCQEMTKDDSSGMNPRITLATKARNSGTLALKIIEQR